MSVPTNHSTTTELTALHERGVHFVLCRAKDAGGAWAAPSHVYGTAGSQGVVDHQPEG